MTWLEHVRSDPLPWLLSEDDPAVRAATLQRLLGAAPHDPAVREARAAAMEVDPIKSILAAQDPAGWWVKPGPGYGPKYQGTVWQVIFLDQLGADPAHPQVAMACDYVLAWSPSVVGGFGASGTVKEAPPPSSAVIHCLNGNLLRALIGFGRFDDERVRAAVEWAARAITGEGVSRWYASGTSGPGFACAANEGAPCAWGAVKEMSALARIPTRRRTALVRRAIDAGISFLFSRDPAVADYPMGWGNTKPSTSWLKPGFPIGYVTDVLQNLEVLAELGHARDPRLGPALAWVEAGQNVQGRWVNRYAYNGKTWVDIERQGQPSKWVTLRACGVLKAAYG
jgi:hypothetical protein